MKNHEKEIKKLLSDEMLRPSDSFKKSLKKNVMRGTAPKRVQRRYFIPALATSFAALAIVAGVLTFDSKNISRNPLQPQTVSAVEIIKKTMQQPKTLGESGGSFVIYKTSSQPGPAHDWCDTEGLGDKAGSIEAYVFNAKDSEHEAMYITMKNDAGEKTFENQYYNTNSEELMGWTSGFDNGLAMLNGDEYMVGGKPYYIVVDSNGNQLKDDTVSPKLINGREVYEFYVKENVEVMGGDYAQDQSTDGSVWCDPRLITTKVTIDAETNRTTRLIAYHGPAEDKNVVTTYYYDLKISNADESEALQIMKNAGFVKEEASSESPGGRS